MRFITRYNGSQGFTLIELMITLLISGIVMIGVFTTFRSQQDTYVMQEEVVVMQQNLRAAMNQMGRELRMATYVPLTNAGGITTATATLIAFTYETDNVGTLQSIQYDLYDAYNDGDTDIGRQVGTVASNKRCLAENIDALEFSYLDASGNATTVLDDIATIKVSILARAARAEPKFLNTHNYFPASCPQPAPPALPDDTCVAGTAWDFDGAIDNSNAFNDNFRRRLLTTTIHLRN